MKNNNCVKGCYLPKRTDSSNYILLIFICISMRKIILFLTLIASFSCNKEKDNLVLTQEQQIQELSDLANYFKNQGNKVTLYNQVDLYKQNLGLINKKLNLDLKFDENDIKLIEQFSERKTSKNIKLSAFYQNQENEVIDKLKESPNYELYLEAMKIIEDVEGRQLSWGCGIALASNFVASLSLVGCATGVGCPLAIAGKALALAGVAASC